jgi:hypothetical protein
LYAEDDKLRFHVLQTGAPLSLPDEEADARAAAEAEVARLREELARFRGEGQ